MKKPNHEKIFLIPGSYYGEHCYVWSDDPAPGADDNPADAVEYVRADLVPAGNDVLAKRIADLARENSELQHRNGEQAKVIEHIAKAVGCEDDPMACWESVDALAAQVDLLLSDLEQSQAVANSYADRVINETQRADLAVIKSQQLAAQVEQLQKDKQRLDAMNAEFNKRNGSNYGWTLDWNCNRIALYDMDPMKLSVRQAIDAAIAKRQQAEGGE